MQASRTLADTTCPSVTTDLDQSSPVKLAGARWIESTTDRSIGFSLKISPDAEHVMQTRRFLWPRTNLIRDFDRFAPETRTSAMAPSPGRRRDLRLWRQKLS